MLDERTGGRVAEGARLERVYTGNRIEGSNPSLSAIYFFKPLNSNNYFSGCIFSPSLRPSFGPHFHTLNLSLDFLRLFVACSRKSN